MACFRALIRPTLFHCLSFLAISTLISASLGFLTGCSDDTLGQVPLTPPPPPAPVVDPGPCPEWHACNDENPCTFNDVCQAGECVGTAYSCDDEDACTADTCDGAGECLYEDLDCPEDLPIEETEWVGWYTCSGAQGKTALTLTTSWNPNTNGMSGIFAFSEHPDNPGLPFGSFSLVGTYNPDDRTMSLLPKAWIVHPGTWNMVGMTGQYDRDARQIHGNITNREGFESMVCETFDLDRVDPDQ
ncbi:MAG: hypothetical protein VYA34_12685 [Myxococcota bacterium]|nr:hypothetical protein [Myxococcota bacterium]